MGEFADVKRKKILKLLKKLAQINGFTITTGGNHQWVIRYTSWQRPFPIPFKQNKLKKCYIEDLAKLVIATGTCTEEVFKEWIG